MFSVTSYGEGVFHLSSGCLVDAWQWEPVNTREISSSMMSRAEILVLA